MAVHLTLGGEWVVCGAHKRSCPRLVHLDMTVAAAQALPMAFLEQLVSAIEPPTRINVSDDMEWLEIDVVDGRSYQRPHRAHGLPAIIQGDGVRIWMVHGRPHRLHGPAIERPADLGQGGHDTWVSAWNPDTKQQDALIVSTTREWWQRGRLHRVGGPAREEVTTGFQEWYNHGQLHRVDGPARIHPRAKKVEYWYRGLEYPDLATLRRGGPAEARQRARMARLARESDRWAAIDLYYAS